ncbi:MFS transporter [Streptomyces sp. KhCrAH-43]|uniref:MFS transporter n=1 Tax=unclassified Streptomyces TaxID=2593676 RepID=UPI000DC395F1|nr:MULTISPECIES: MFS transporter [unclassified Streptomyces]RAJ56016.1 MFS transporter [Streptomyces sp. KhCrAH-43]
MSRYLGVRVGRAERGPERAGLVAQLRNPPGGRDARIMLRALAVDRTGTGLWAASSVLYLTFVTHLSAQQIGVLLGTAGVAGIAGSPLAGRLAGRFPVRPLLIGCHLLRLVTLVLVLLCTRFDALLVVVAVTYLGDRAAKTLEMLFATRVAGERRSAYQALSRSAANAGYGLGAGLAAIGLAVGTTDAYRALILGNALSFLVAAVLVRRTKEAGGRAVATGPAGRPVRAKGPWRDRGYLRFVLLDIPMNLDDSVLGVGLPLWLVGRTSAPHALVPAFLVINTVLVVLLQLAVSRRVDGPRGAVRAVALYGVLLFVTCALLAASTGCGTWTAAAVLLAAAVLVTMAELMRSVSSWELAVLLAPPDERAAYLGVAGMSQSIQKSAGPPLLTGVVMAAGPAGWLALGAAVAVLAVAQRRGCARRLESMGVPEAEPQPARQ